MKFNEDPGFTAWLSGVERENESCYAGYYELLYMAYCQGKADAK